MKEVIINKLTKLSEHFELGELTKTKTGIDNVPNEEQVENLKRLCGWLEKLRKRWNEGGWWGHVEQSSYGLCRRYPLHRH